MKVTMDYVVGNTAIQIVNTGKKVKIVDVEKQKKKRNVCVVYVNRKRQSEL